MHMQRVKIDSQVKMQLFSFSLYFMVNECLKIKQNENYPHRQSCMKASEQANAVQNMTRKETNPSGSLVFCCCLLLHCSNVEAKMNILLKHRERHGEFLFFRHYQFAN